MAHRTHQDIARLGARADAAVRQITGAPEDSHALFGAHHCHEGKCAVGCPGPWPCAVAIARASGDSTPARWDGER
jgi:hypothetical protein